MSCSSAAAACIIALSLTLTGCQKTQTAERIAVLRFENLTSDPSFDWLGRGFADMLETQLAGAPSISVIASGSIRAFARVLGPHPASAPGISAERAEALLAGANRVIYGTFSGTGGKLRLEVVLENPDSQKIVRTGSSAGEPADLFALSDAVARQLSKDVRPYGTRNPQALKAYAEALDASDASSASNALARAVSADADFGAAYVAWSHLALSRRDPTGVERVAEMARARGNAISPLDRARLDLDAALIRGDTARQSSALSTLARLNPADPALLRTLAETEFNARRFQPSIEHFRKAIALQPADPLLLNLFGYAQAYAGDLKSAVTTLREYERMQPGEANPLDSLGDVYFYAGQFSDAEKFYQQAYEKNPGLLNGELIKAAHARLMTGDIKAANSIFDRYVQGLRGVKDPLIEFRLAEWEYLTGRCKPAVTRLEAFAASQAPQARDVIARAESQLSIWFLELGLANRARESAAKAVAVSGPASAGLSAVTRFITEPPAAASEWAVRAERTFSDPAANPVKNFALAYALLFAKEFSAAAPLLKQIYDGITPTSEEGTPVLYAWTLVETGRFQDAAKLLKAVPLPQASGPGPFASLYLPRIFFLRAQVLDKQGQREEAKQNYRLFLTLSGPDAKIFGEEKRARQALEL